MRDKYELRAELLRRHPHYGDFRNANLQDLIGDVLEILGEQKPRAAAAEVRPLPALSYETVIREVGTTGLGPSRVSLACHTEETTIHVSEETARAFAAHLYRRVRVTVEVLPSEDVEKDPPSL